MEVVVMLRLAINNQHKDIRKIRPCAWLKLFKK